jgi:predicted metal-binding membrane protein
MTADWLPRQPQAHRSVVLASLGVVVALAWTYPLLGSGTEDGDDGIILRNVALEVSASQALCRPV